MKVRNLLKMSFVARSAAGKAGASHQQLRVAGRYNKIPYLSRLDRKYSKRVMRRNGII